jgi:UDP-glucose 4-epimerase
VQHVNVGSGRAVSVTELVVACERVLGYGIEVEVDSRRTRTVDRQELVADNALLRRLTRWAPTRALYQTLAEMLADPTER